MRVLLAAAALTFAACLAGATSQTSLAKSVARDSRIAFVRDSDLYAMNSDGSAATRLANGGGLGIEFAWSRGGARIAFLRQRDDPRAPYRHYPGDIYVMKSDGSGLRRITRRSPLNPSALSWSSDGRWLAYSRSVDTCNLCSEWPFEVVVVNGSSGNERLLTARLANSRFPAWSPTGRWIALEGVVDAPGGGVDSIHVVGNEGSRIRRLTEGSGPLQWSPDGRQLLFLRGSDIWRIGVDGSGGRRLVRGVRVTDDFGGLLPPPSWSPDGQRIVFARNAGGSRAHIWVMDADGAHKRRLTAGAAEDEGPVWSPDGTQIAFTRYVYRGGENYNFSIYAINADGRGLHRLTRGPYDRSPEWQPLG